MELKENEKCGMKTTPINYYRANFFFLEKHGDLGWCGGGGLEHINFQLRYRLVNFVD